MRAPRNLVVTVLGLAMVGSGIATADGTATGAANAGTADTKIQTPYDDVHVQDEEVEASDQRKQQPPTGQGAVSVEMGEQDGIRIDFVGRAEGTVPSPAGERPSHATLANKPAVQPAGHDGGAEFQLLRCDGGSFAAGEDGSLTVKGVCDHMLGKLMQSAQQNALNSNSAGAQAGVFTDTEGDAPSAISGIGYLVSRALAVATAPVSYLFGMLGGVPVWFSDAVFEVKLKEGVKDKALSQRLLLVHDPPRSVQLACSILSPSSSLSSSSSSSSATTGVSALLHSFCRVDYPFPGKILTRPCLVKASRKGWIESAIRMALSYVGLVGDGEAGGVAGGSAVCECAAGGAGPCTVHAPPGRDPCLYVEVTDGEGWGKGSRKRRTRTIGAESLEVTSSVELRTYPLTTAIEESCTGDGGGGAAGEGREVTGVLSALQVAVVERGLPSSVTVPVYGARLAAGAALVFLAQPLSESRVFHYLLSALLGGMVGAAGLLLRALGNPRRVFLRVLVVCGLAMWLVMAAGGDFVPSPVAFVTGLPGIMLALWNDGFVGCPWAGKASFAASGLAGVFMTWSQGLFLDEGGVGSRRSWFNGQACIRRVLTYTGVLLVFYGVSDAEVGATLVTLTLVAPSLGHFALRYSMWTNRSKWYRAGARLSAAEYEAEGDEYTRQALKDLHATTTENWSDIKKKLKKRTRKKMVKFVQSQEHFTPTDEDEDSGPMYCTVQ